MEHGKALITALALVDELRLYCNEIEIAGSVRRGKPEVKDIEIVCVSKVVDGEDMFGAKVGVRSLLLEYLASQDFARNILIKGKDRYRQYLLVGGIKLDLFMVMPPAQFGLQYVIRTGPAEFSHWFVTPRKYGGGAPSNYIFKQGAAWLHGEIVPMPTEESVFGCFGLPFINPADRVPRWGVFHER